jgi:hypothetical protein
MGCGDPPIPDFNTVELNQGGHAPALLRWPDRYAGRC